MVVPEVVPLEYYRAFPLIAGGSWLITVLTLFIVWMAKGRPNYPVRGPDSLPFISDIAAFALKPLFITGAIISGVTFVLSIVAIHHVRHDKRMHGHIDVRRSKAIKIFSVLSIFFVTIAGCSLVLLSVFDTYNFHRTHMILLFVMLLSTLCSVASVSIVYYQEMKADAGDRLLRYSCLAGSSIMALEVILGIPFWIMIATGHKVAAVAIEWIMAILISLYLFSIVGILGPVRSGHIKLPERPSDATEDQSE